MTLFLAEFFANRMIRIDGTNGDPPKEVPAPFHEPPIRPIPPSPEITPVPETPTEPSPGVVPEISPVHPPPQPVPVEIPPEEEPEEEPDEDRN